MLVDRLYYSSIHIHVACFFFSENKGVLVDRLYYSSIHIHVAWFFVSENKGVLVDRLYCGTFMTSLEMAGISITLLILDDTLKACLGEFICLYCLLRSDAI